MNSRASKVMRRALVWSAVLSVAVGFIGATVGVIVAGAPGAAGAFWGAGMGLVFLGITTVSVRVASHFDTTVFFAVVMGSWMLKILLFGVLVLLLRGRDDINGPILFVCLVVVMLGTLTVDVISFARGRVPYVDDAPSDSSSPR